MQPADLSSTAPCIAKWARETPDAVAITEGSLQVKYNRLAADLQHCAHALEALGIAAGTLVGVETPIRYQHLVLLLACETIGAVTLSLTPTQLSGQPTLTRHCDILLVSIVPPDYHRQDDQPNRIAIAPDWFESTGIPAADRNDRLQPPSSPDRVVRIVRTSGSTGQPKTMPMTAATQQLRIVRAIGRVADSILPNPRFLCIYSLAVSTIYVRVLGILQQGGTVRFATEQEACAMIAAGAVNYAKFVVGDAERLVRDAETSKPNLSLTVEVFGATVSARLRQAIRERWNAVVVSVYSSNETNPIAVMDEDNVGTLCPGVEVRIVGDDGQEQQRGSAGHIRVRSETMVHSYFDDPSLTAKAFVDGWFRTGDIGTIPAPGKLIVAGRVDDMLNIGGVKVARLPLEAQLRQINGVGDAVALSVPNRNGVGDLIVAIEAESESLSNDLWTDIGRVLARHVRQFQIAPVRRFPRSDSGKVMRADIEALITQRSPADLPPQQRIVPSDASLEA
jgi:acyl-coenzyme A synthetase/AMP-(fatty) acid ligase